MVLSNLPDLSFLSISSLVHEHIFSIYGLTILIFIFCFIKGFNLSRFSHKVLIESVLIKTAARIFDILSMYLLSKL